MFQPCSLVLCSEYEKPQKPLSYLAHSGFGLIALKSVLGYITKNHLTTNDPYYERVQKKF